MTRATQGLDPDHDGIPPAGERPLLSVFDRELEQYHLQGHWKMELPNRLEPRSRLQPVLWRWRVLRPLLLRSAQLITVDEAGRRTLQLLNPGLAPLRSTTHTLQMSLQVVLPGERALAHRHTMAAIRFVVEGSGAFTTVEGASFLMEPGDLILTPNWTWHDHLNESEAPIIWIDGLDVPFCRTMDTMFIEEYERPAQTVQRVVRTAEEGSSSPGGARWYYKWRDTERALRQLAAKAGDDEHEVVLEYRDHGQAATLPTIACGVQLLRPGERTRTCRRTSCAVYHVVRGRGRTVVGDSVLEWERGDCFVVPNWAWHYHENPSSEESFLFFMSDRPLLEPFGLYREAFQ